MRVRRGRPVVLGLVALPAVVVALALAGTADAAPAFAATASVSNAPQYLGDTAGTAFTFTITNTGSETSIGAVEIQRPTNGWTITSCGTAGTWAAQKADPRCRFRSGETGADDLMPGQSRQLTVTATTAAGTADRVGKWDVTVSRSNQFDQPSLLTAAEGTGTGLQVTAHTWEVLDATVSSAGLPAGSACPAPDKDEQTNATVTMVVCGRNHATVPLTPSAAWSSLAGTFLQQAGTFSSGQVAANSAPVVVGSWTGAKVAGLPGKPLTVVARIASAAGQTSPLTTLTGYEAINAAPTAADDAYSVAEDGWLAPSAPGVLGNDSDPESQPITAVLESAPAHAETFQLYGDGSFTYVPADDYAGADSFTYRAHDGIQASASAATVTLAVTAVNDAPVNTAPASVGAEEETPYAFGQGALAVADVDAGGSDVRTRLTVAGASVTVGTGGVAVTGNGTGDVTVTGPLSALDAALDAATLVPDSGFSGTTTLTMATSDLGHTGAGGALTDTDTVAVTVLAVNDAPSFTAGPDQTVAEDAGLRTVPGWATAISAGGPGEAGQTLTFTTTDDNAALFQTAPAVSPDGTLTYRANPNAYGTATVTVTLSDDGGTANGGDDTSDPQTFTITVTPVNDAPAAAAHAYTAQANMALTVSGLLDGATDAADAGATYTPSFTLASVTPLSCSGCVVSAVDSAAGSFDLATPAGFTGTVTLAYTVTDSGQPAPGATSAPATVTVSVQGPVIWFVDGSVAGPGTGTLTDPFRTLTSAATAAAAPGSRVFVASGTVTGGISQPANGWLVGQGVSGASFDAVFGIAPPAGTVARPSVNGTRPTVVGGVALADGSVVRGLDVAPPSGTAGLVGVGDDGVTVAEVAVTTTNARAVDVTGSQGSTFALTGVSATGAPEGIRLSTVNTTSPGSFSAGGGTIAGSTGTGVSLTSVKGVSLSGLAVSGSGGEGVFGSMAGDVSLTDVTVSGSGTHGISLANGTGTATLTRVTVSGSAGDNARVFGSSGTAALTVTDSVFRDNGATTGGHGLLVEADGSAAMTFTSSGSSYLRNRMDALAVYALSSARTTATVNGSTVVMNGGVGMDVVSNGTGGLAYTVDGGTVTGCAACGVPVNVYKGTGATGTGGAALAGAIRNLTVSNGDSANAPGIWVHGEGAGGHRVEVTGNTVTAVGHQGILASAGNGSSTLDATIAGNTVTLGASGLQGVQVDSGTISTDTTAVCADIKGNTVSSPLQDVRVRNRMVGTTFRLPGYSGAATSTSSVTAFEIAQNTITDAAAVVSSSPGFAGGAACAAP
ncbi:MAG TPA: tandem-95 repeat protein [Frankiaceae bacterium]|jgi:hypothetical protein|nr:tandem-95 repeat protein [Frankiaceae bacterium]